MSDKTKGWIQLAFVGLFIIGSFLISGLLSAITPDDGKSVNGDRTLFVKTKTIQPQSYQIEFDATGSVETRGTVNIVPEVSGRIVMVNEQFYEGGMFEAGDILFEIEPLDFELAVQGLNSEVARAQTSLDLEKAEAEAALAEWKQFNPHKKVPALVAREPQLAEARANLKAAQAQLDDAKLNLERTKFSLPFNGRVLSSSLAQGQYAVAGQSYGRVFGLDTLEVVSSLEGQKLEWLLEATTPDIKITTTYLGQTNTYDGYLKRSASSLNAQTRFATVSFGFKDKNVELVPGIFARIDVKGTELQNVMVFPAEALQKENVIWLVDDQNTLMRYDPDVIYRDDKHVIVQSEGEALKAVVNKLSGATQGTEVEINNDAE